MLSKETILVLILDGQHIPPDVEGAYHVPYRLIRSENLSLLPEGVTIHVVSEKGEEQANDPEITVEQLATPPEHATDPEIAIEQIEVLGQERVCVLASYPINLSFWPHAMNHRTYSGLVSMLLFKEASQNSGFTLDGIDLNHGDGIAYQFILETNNGPFDAIETAVKERVLGVLKPANEMRHAFNQEVRRQLGH